MAGYEIWALCAVACVFLAGGVVKGGIGLGLPTVSIGLMAIWMPVEQAAGILILPVILTNIWQVLAGTALKLVLIRLWTMLVAMMIGSAAAAILIASANQALAAGLLGTMLIIYAALALSGARFSVPVRMEGVWNPVIGLATGLISGATAIFVIPAVPYLQSLHFASGRPGREEDPTDPTRAHRCNDDQGRADTIARGHRAGCIGRTGNWAWRQGQPAPRCCCARADRHGDGDPRHGRGA